MVSKSFLSTFIAAAALFAQPSPNAQWVPLDSSKPGTPADIRLDRANSDANKTSVDILIHGFYVEPKVGPDGSYQKISVPGLASFAALGSPDLPSARINVAVMTDAKVGRLASVKALLPARKFSGIQVWPKIIGERDDEKSHPEEFRKDEAAYKNPVSWPPTDGVPTVPVKRMVGGISGLRTDVFLFKWNPATKELSVTPSAKATFDHTGAATRVKATRHADRLAANTFINHAVVNGGILVNHLFFEGDFLFIYPDGYKNELQPLIDQKKARGYHTTEKTTTTTGKTCAGIRAAIQSWYNSRPLSNDKYALLVGDVNEIPLCDAPTGVPTDDLYASVDGDDLDEEIYLGRLSVDTEADLTNQVTKILEYEDSPSLFCCYDKALLVAHKENAPGKYVGAHESVRTASYAVPPVFSTLYGHNAGVDDADVSLSINTGLGLVAYRGHGSSSAWTTWNNGNESYNSTDVTGLANLGSQVPVVWSLACTNSALGSEDSIGEVWMEDSNNRAVSFYGSTVASYTSLNHELDRQLFKAVYDSGLTVQSHAIKQAEDQMAMIAGSENAWMYLLLGDPEMTIRRRNPISLNWKIQIPAEYRPCYGPGCYLNVSILDQVGNPAPFVKVAAWKPVVGTVVGDQVLSNRYTDKAGKAQIPVSGITAGKLIVTFTDDAGNSETRTVVVR